MSTHVQPGDAGAPLAPQQAPVAPPPPAPRRGRRRWIAIGAAVAVVVAGAAAAVWWFWPAPPPTPPMPADIKEAPVRAAIEAARQNVLQRPRDADAWGLLGMTLMTHLFADEADRCFAEAARLNPQDPRWPYARGLLALKRDPDHAVALLQRAADLPAPPEDQSQYRLQLAEALLDRQRLDEAEKLFRQELDHPASKPRAAYGLGLIAVARDDKKAAQEYLTAACTGPNAHQKGATAQLAALARASGHDDAAAAYEKVLAELPNDPPWPDPIEDRILDLQQGHRQLERETAQLEMEKRDQEAADLYLQWIDEDPNNVTAYTGAGRCFYRLKQYDGAFDLLREGTRRNPNSSAAHYSLAQMLFALAEKREHQSSVTAAEKKEDHDLFEEAAAEAKRATEIKPDFAEAYDFWGQSLTYLGKPGEAVKPLLQGVNCRPNSIDLKLALAEALMDSGDKKEAERYLKEAGQLDPNDQRLHDDLEKLHKMHD